MQLYLCTEYNIYCSTAGKFSQSVLDNIGNMLRIKYDKHRQNALFIQEESYTEKLSIVETSSQARYLKSIMQWTAV